MKQKQFLGVALGLVVLIVVITVVFQLFVVKRAPQQAAITTQGANTSTPSSRKLDPAEEAKKMGTTDPIPESIDDIAGSIQSESALDLTALDEEEAGSLDEITKDSDSVTNLGTSYDEKSL